MGKVVASASMSLDGFVAHENNDPGRLFDWYEAGDVEVVTASEPALVPPDTRERRLLAGLGGRDRLPRRRTAAVRHHRRLAGRAPARRAVRRADARGADGLGARPHRQRPLRDRRHRGRRSRVRRRSPEIGRSRSPPARSRARRSVRASSTRSPSTSCRSCSAAATATSPTSTRRPCGWAIRRRSSRARA